MPTAKPVLVFRQIAAQAFGELFGSTWAGVIPDDHEFVTTPSYNGVRRATTGFQDLFHLDQSLVSRLMAVGVVNILEAVEVNHHKEHGRGDIEGIGLGTPLSGAQGAPAD